jgi:poly(hydroxyalkanoate) granule-associated protein
MAKKLKSIAVDKNIGATIRESAQQIWLAGLGAYGKAQQEGNKVFDALVREGEALQAATRKVAEDKVNEMAAKATGTWDKLEQVFEKRVSKALNSLGVPTKSDIEGLAARVAVLTAEVEKLNGGTPIEAPAPKAARRRAPAAADVVADVVEVVEAPVKAVKTAVKRAAKVVKPAAEVVAAE